ncbi:MAG: DUF3575 domain-containing protein [Bacteroidales bacterium]|nr:DUF3575 domain-containing protein [Bacteroidales bacterium]
MRVHFRFDSSELVQDYMSNESAILSLDQFLKATDSQVDVQIIAYSSPEGNESYNKRLSYRRAVAVKDYILSVVPGANPTIMVMPESEAWKQFRKYVLSDKKLSAESRSELLFVIDSDATADEKEELIKANPDYKRLYTKYFRSLRYADISLRIKKSAVFAYTAANSAASTPVVYFPVGSSNVVPGYKNNETNLEEMVAFFRENPSAADDFVIVGSASPEGPTSLNNRLALMRAKILADYIAERVPELRGKLKIKSAGEDWAGLRDAVCAEESLTPEQKSLICSIIDSDAPSADKKAALKQHPAYKTVSTRCFENLRCQSVAPADSSCARTSASVNNEPVAEEPANDEPAAVDQQGNADTTSVVPVDTLPRLPRLARLSTKAAVLGESAPVERDTTFAESGSRFDNADSTATERVPFVAVANNFLANLATVGTAFHTVPIQAGIEVPVGDQWSIYADYLGTAPWHAWNGNADCVELLHWTLGTRWYPGSKFATPFTPGGTERILEGWYASLSVGGGYYDFEHNGKGYQGEEVLGSLGLGYSLCFNEHWSLNFGIGFGPMFTQWRYYEKKSTSQALVYKYSGNSKYFGPTEAKVSLTYLFYVNRKKNNR